MRVSAAQAAENSDEENAKVHSQNNEDDDGQVNNGVNDGTQDNHNDQVDGPSGESPIPKTEPQSEWLGTGDMFQGDSSPHLSFMPVS